MPRTAATSRARRSQDREAAVHLPDETGKQQPERHLRLLVEQMPAIVWTANAEYRFTSVQGAGLENVDAEPGAMEVDMAAVLGTGETAIASMTAHERALQGKPSSYTASWGDRTYECSVEPLQSEDQIVGSIGVAVDVTERRRAERDALNAFEEAVECIVRAIELRDIGTGAHVERMSYYCMVIAEALDLSQENCHAIALASRLHDVGKTAVPDGILLKQGRLTSEERQIMQRHCEAGHKILGISQNRILQLAAEIALTHHEWWSGGGYPRGLVGQEIPLAGRIAAIADAFDALTSDRPYRGALSYDDAMRVMNRGAREPLRPNHARSVPPLGCCPSVAAISDVRATSRLVWTWLATG
jgi:HD-GYP domain-containing protein (c-di-GMP phosphodiesterase class II)